MFNVVVLKLWLEEDYMMVFGKIFARWSNEKLKINIFTSV